MCSPLYHIIVSFVILFSKFRRISNIKKLITVKYIMNNCCCIVCLVRIHIPVIAGTMQCINTYYQYVKFVNSPGQVIVTVPIVTCYC